MVNKGGRPKNKDYTYTYKEADKYFCVNEGDDDLKPVYIGLPTPPDYKLIDGYGLSPNDQFFRRHEMPQKLVNLEKRVVKDLTSLAVSGRSGVTGSKVVNSFWEILESEKEYYEDEIAWMEKVVWHCIHGYWFFNKGKPTFISPFHYELLNFWYNPDLKNLGFYFEYRERDRKKMLYDYYAYTTKETFADVDENGFAVVNEEGFYTMKEMGSRTLYGTIKAKNRRSGETHQGLLYCWSIIRKQEGAVATLVSKTGKDTIRYWDEKFLPAWRNYPIFLKPIWDGNNDPSELNLNPASNDFISKGLNSRFFYTTSADEVANDGGKLFAALFDEQAKEVRQAGKVDVYKRFMINKLTMSQGEDIHGFCTNPSTVEEMNAGGEVYIQMFEDSFFYRRLPSGQTKTGLISMFTPAQDGWEGFIDPWGYSVIENPSKRLIEETYEFCKKYNKPSSLYKYLSGRGAYIALNAEREVLLKENTPQSLKLYRETVRKQPMKFADCLTGGSGDIDLPIELVNARMNEIRADKDKYKGYFRWKGGIVDGEVEFINDPRGYIDLIEAPDYSLRNNRVKRKVFNPVTQEHEFSYFPLHGSTFTCGVDSFEFSEELVATKGTSKSDGGISILKHGTDHLTQSPDNRWDGFKFVLSARYRTSQDEFDEQVLMACVYFGAMMYPERNKTSTWKHFIKRGYRGYLKYDVDEHGKPLDKPGYSVQDKTDLFLLLGVYLEHRTMYEDCYYFLEECKEIRSVKELTKKDRLAAHLAALKGSQSSYSKMIGRVNYNQIDLSSVLNLKKRY